MNITSPFRNKKFLATIVVILLVIISVVGYNYFTTSETITSPVAKTAESDALEAEYEGITPGEPIALDSKTSEKGALAQNKGPGNPEDKSKNFNILILGIDRRYGDQTHWRTDVIQLLTLSPNRNSAVITHIPRDLWADKYKINATYNLQGPEEMKNVIEEVTGQRPDRIIRLDFDAFVWVVDAVGGLTINVPTGFTDSGYPNDRKGINEPITVSFESGQQTMDGETALIYARSRKGTNGEGSDYARGTRQQIIMKEIIDDFFQPDNLFNPKIAEVLYRAATEKIYTDFTLTDTKILFDVLKNYKDITIKQLGLDTSNFLVHPADSTPYGGAWTLIAKGGTYTPIHEEIELLLTN